MFKIVASDLDLYIYNLNRINKKKKKNRKINEYNRKIKKGIKIKLFKEIIIIQGTRLSNLNG